MMSLSDYESYGDDLIFNPINEKPDKNEIKKEKLMRKIEFQGKNYEGDWFRGGLITHEDTAYIVQWDKQDNDIWHEVDIDTVGEYIGKKDNKGSKIFEGDKLKIYNYNYNYEYGVEHKSLKSIYYGVVEYSDITGFKVNTRIKENEDKKILERESYEEFKDCEIIGNIHEISK